MRRSFCLVVVSINESCDVRVGRGAPLPGDGIWLDGGSDTANTEDSERMLAFKFGKRRELLAKHLNISRHKGEQIDV